jgi:GNAT superfamily N-acetyltransferase
MPIIRRCRDGEHAALLEIINLAAQKYRGVIPADRWHEPYMSGKELAAELAAGVEFWGAEIDATLAGVMGVQQVLDVDLIRHAYVLPAFQRKGIGGLLLAELCSRRSRTILIGTWAAASWAIDFYERHGFDLVGVDEATTLLKKYWTIPERQIETSVVLRLAR